MATIKDVADYARVSVTTVSHVLNKTRFVSPELETRVWEAIKATKYQPNALARSLRNKQTRTLGMIVPDNSNPFFAEIARYIEEACFDQEFNVILCNTEQSLDKEQRYIEVLLEKQVDGIVFVATGGHSQNLGLVLSRSIPTVLIDRELPSLECDIVVSNNNRIGHQATGYLIEQGHKVIACIAGPSDVTPSWERVEGYRQELEAAGIEYRTEIVCRGDFQAAAGYTAMQSLLEKEAGLSAVFACNDIMAIGAMRAISESGRRIPQDVAVVGVDDIPLAAFTNPPLTTIAQPLEEMGRLAARLLIGRINGDERALQRYVLDSRLVIRQSS